MTLIYKIPPTLPFTQGGITLFDKWFDKTHHPELVEGEGRPACAKPLRRRQGGDFSTAMSVLF